MLRLDADRLLQVSGAAFPHGSPAMRSDRRARVCNSCLRPTARRRRVSCDPLSALFRISCASSACSGLSSTASCRISALPMITPSRLLKSCAIPPVSCPSAFIFSDCAAFPRYAGAPQTWHSARGASPPTGRGRLAIPLRRALAHRSHASNVGSAGRASAMRHLQIIRHIIESIGDHVRFRRATIPWRAYSVPRQQKIWPPG